MGTVSTMSNAQKQELYQSNQWSQWLPFPDPKNKGILCAPFGSGVYQLRNKKTNKFVLFGQSKNVAKRMTSLLPSPWGAGIRFNSKKRNEVKNNLSDIEYRTMALDDKEDAVDFEKYIKQKEDYMFNEKKRHN